MSKHKSNVCHFDDKAKNMCVCCHKLNATLQFKRYILLFCQNNDPLNIKKTTLEGKIGYQHNFSLKMP